jgi:hypothetical protein
VRSKLCPAITPAGGGYILARRGAIAPATVQRVRAYGCRKPNAVRLAADVSGKRYLPVRNSFEADVHAAVWPSSV